MNNAGLISVVLPIYNVAPYLPKCLESVISNTYRDLEIICVNDGSSDNSMEILKEYSEKDHRIVIVDKENGGLSSARNAGMRIATGEFIAFVDSDDWVHERYFEILLSMIKKNDADVSICSYVRTKGDIDWPEIGEYKEQVVDALTMINTYAIKNFAWRRLFRRSSIEGIWFDENEKIEDYVFNMDLIVFGPKELKMVYTDIPLYAYFMREGSLVTKLNIEYNLQIAERLCRYLPQADNKIKRRIVADEAVVIALSARYSYLILKDQEKVKRCNIVIRSCIAEMKKKKALYIVFWIIPEAYRQFRLRTDSSMKTYEKMLKQRRMN